MVKEIYINLPVADVQKSRTFFKSLGFAENPQFSGDGGACMIVNEMILVMLCPHARFKDFTPKEVCDTTKAVEVLFNLRCDSREEVDSLVAKALAAGGSTYDKPEDLGFMYSHSFLDLDGHGWGVLHIPTAPAK